nr:MAG TPA: hypothetical protein [Caudoviricetes sp.]
MAYCVWRFNSSTGYQQPFFTRKGENTEQKGSEIRFHSYLCFSACLQYASVVCYSVWAHSWIAGTRPCHDQKQADSPERRAICWALGHDLEFGSFRCGLFIGFYRPPM